jgi:hypothetical protein
MKVKIKDIEIECTVDEYQELVKRNLLSDETEQKQDNGDLSIDDNDWLRKLIKQEPNKTDPWRDMTVMCYGCQMPPGPIVPFAPINPSNGTTSLTTAQFTNLNRIVGNTDASEKPKV